MPLLTAKIKCPSCGAKQLADNVRCENCTRPLEKHRSASEAVYTEALWSQAIDDKRSRTTRINPLALVVVAILTIGLANWFHFRVGPEWAHSPAPWVKGSDWKTYRGVPGVRVDLPGNPITGSVPGPNGPLSSAMVWLDSEWVARRDANTRAVGVLTAARSSLHAILTVAGGPAPSEPRAALAETVGALLGGTLVDPVTTERQDPTLGRQYDLVATFEGAPDQRGTGTIRARAIVTADAAGTPTWYLALTATLAGDDTELHDDLVADLVPDVASRR